MPSKYFVRIAILAVGSLHRNIKTECGYEEGPIREASIMQW